MYHIIYENSYAEGFYQNEVKEFHAYTVKKHPKKKRWKRRTKKAAIQFVQTFTPTELGVEENIMSLSIENIRVISYLRNEDFDMSKEDKSSEMIKVCTNNVNSEMI